MPAWSVEDDVVVVILDTRQSIVKRSLEIGCFPLPLIGKIERRDGGTRWNKIHVWKSGGADSFRGFAIIAGMKEQLNARYWVCFR